MARLSTIDRLPAEVREKIGELRRAGHTLDEILAKLAELAVSADVSRSALGRHVQTLDKLGEKLRRSRAMAEGLARGLGDKPADEVTRASIELLHNAVFELLQDAGMAEGEEGEAAKALVRNPQAAKFLAETIEKLVKASRHNVEFVEKVETRAANKAKADAAIAVDQVGKARGLTADTLAAIKASIFGVKAA
jgi:hypothetical protein